MQSRHLLALATRRLRQANLPTCRLRQVEKHTLGLGDVASVCYAQPEEYTNGRAQPVAMLQSISQRMPRKQNESSMNKYTAATYLHSRENAGNDSLDSLIQTACPCGTVEGCRRTQFPKNIQHICQCVNGSGRIH